MPGACQGVVGLVCSGIPHSPWASLAPAMTVGSGEAQTRLRVHLRTSQHQGCLEMRRGGAVPQHLAMDLGAGTPQPHGRSQSGS